VILAAPGASFLDRGLKAEDNGVRAGLQLLDETIKELSRDLPAAEQANGWTEEDRLYFLDYFLKLRAQHKEGNSKSPYDLEYINVSRIMDDRGIS